MVQRCIMMPDVTCAAIHGIKPTGFFLRDCVSFLKPMRQLAENAPHLLAFHIIANILLTDTTYGFEVYKISRV